MKTVEQELWSRCRSLVDEWRDVATELVVIADHGRAAGFHDCATELEGMLNTVDLMRRYGKLRVPEQK